MTNARFGICEWYGKPLASLAPADRRQLANIALASVQGRPPPQGSSPECPYQANLPPCSKKGGVCSLQRYQRAAGNLLGPPHDVAMVAQRGVGKTALLQWLQRQAAGIGLRIVDLTRRELTDTRQLMLQTLPQAEAEAVGARTEREVTARLGGGAGPLVALVSQTRRSASEGRLSPQAWRDAMGRAAQNQACSILADEAHHFHRNVAGGLFEGVQKMRGSGFPVALVIAGTPDTWNALDRAGASFHNRLGKGRLPLSLLDEPASMQAVGDGLRASGLNVQADEDALRMIHADSQGYPYFLQVWGEALYDGLDWPKERTVTASHVEAAWVEANRVCAVYYGDRWREMVDTPEFGSAGLAPVCAAVALGVLSSGGEDAVVADAGVDNWVAEGLRICGTGALEDARRLMRHKGFLVNAADGLSKAGIPSLMRHTLRAAVTAKRVPSSWSEGLDLEPRPPPRSAV